ncbi:uncharacterized protein LOC128553122 [Mercenaria mercenaria]|uniref:uncharacterized protein LOC128553122 n=1 Tax=Mercenaria mercenaria TaxID=6596 RepID=UPI00234F956B|nr:uncharacterized protein LOC128553122 [Mercenaria mercenaria]
MTILRIEALILSLIPCACTQTVTLSPTIAQVIVNQSVTLTCSINEIDVAKFSRWEISESPRTGVIVPSNGTCLGFGFLADETKYSLHCNGNNTFSVTIKRVTIQDHAQTWRCSQAFIFSNQATIFVKSKQFTYFCLFISIQSSSQLTTTAV